MTQNITLLLALSMCFFLSSKAQLSRGNVLTGVNFSYNSTDADNVDGKQRFLSIAPNISSIYKDNKVIGISVGYSRAKNASNDDLGTTGIDAKIYLRQYHNLGKNFSFFLQESGGVAFIKATDMYEYPDVIRTTKSTTTYLSLNPAFAYNATKNLQIEIILLGNVISAGYTHGDVSYNQPNYGDYKNNNFYISTNGESNILNSLGLGIKLIL